MPSARPVVRQQQRADGLPIEYALLAAIAMGLGLLGGLALTPVLTRNITRSLGAAAR